VANPVIGIDIVARLDKLRAEIATLSPEMAAEAKAMTAALGKEIARQASAIRQVGNAARSAGSGMGAAAGQAQSLRAQLLDVVQQAAAGQNPLMILNQQGFQIAQAMQGGAGASAALAAALGPVGAAAITVAAAAGVAYGAWRQLHEEQERGARVAAELMDSSRDLAGIYEQQRVALANLAVARGEMTDADMIAFTTGLAIQKQLNSAQAETSDRVSELRVEAGSLAAQWAEWGESLGDSLGWLNPLGKAIDGLTQSSSELDAEADALMAGMARQAEKVAAAREEIVKARLEEKALTEAKKNAIDLTRRYAEMMEEEARRRAEVAEGIDELRAIAREAATSQLDGYAAILARTEDQVAAVREQREELEALARTEAERAAVIAEAGAAILAIREAELEKVREVNDELAETERARLARVAASEREYTDWLDGEWDRRAEKVQQYGDAVANVLGSVAGFAAQMSSNMADENEKAARDWWIAQKTLAIAQATAQTAVAVTTALATPPAPNIPLAVMAGVAGAAQIATIAAQEPSFHAGGTMYPDEQRARVLGGEAILNRQAAAALGPGGVAAINQGMAAPSMAPATLQIGRIEAREIARTDIAARGAIPAAIRRGVARGTRGAGRSGRGPVA